MSETLAYIEAYFENQLSETDRKLFEEKCVTDKSFAGDVVFYVSARQTLKGELLNNKASKWEGTAIVKPLPVADTTTNISRRSWLRSAAVAASLVLVASLYFLLRTPSPQQLASNYIDTYYLSQTMGVAEDTLELGKEAYISGDYGKAAALFEALAINHPENAEAKQFAGLAYLKQDNYIKALNLFDSLTVMKIHSNPGLFLKATALLLRNTNDDAVEAKRLLEQVVKENLEGSDEAEKWLKRWK